MATSNNPHKERPPGGGPRGRPSDEQQPERDENTEQSYLQGGRQGPGGEGMIHPTPSQAEGDRDAIDEDIDEKLGGKQQQDHPQYAASAGIDQQSVQHTPSQAEGDRETVDEDLDEKEGH